MLESTADSHALAGSPLRFISVKRGCAVGEFAVHHCGLLHDKGHMRGSSSRSSGKQRNPELDGSVAGNSKLHLHDACWLFYVLEI